VIYDPAFMRPPLTIWRYTLLELGKLVGLSTAVLVTVIVFAAAVRYTAVGRLSALDTLRFMALASVPMLQYALPFAAGFGATLAYHRMASDNELRAAAASGVSHRALLLPALASGVLLTCILALLTTQVIPTFLKLMERMVTEDMTKMVVANIQRGQTVDLEGYTVHADSVRPLGPQPNQGFTEVLLLTGVTAVGTDRQGRVERDATASQAIVAFGPAMRREAGEGTGPASSGGTRVMLSLKKFVAWDPEQGVVTAESSQPRTWIVPSVFDDNPKFLTSGELARLPRDPDRLNIIDSRRRELALRIAERRAMDDLDKELRARKMAVLEDPQGRRSVTLRAAGLKWNQSRPSGAPARWDLEPPAPGKPIEAEVSSLEGVEPPRRFTARAGGIRGDSGRDVQTLSFRLELEGFSGAEGESGMLANKDYLGLVPASHPLGALLERPSADLIALARSDPRLGGDEAVSSAADRLDQRIIRLKREVVSKQHERAAISVACLVMVLAGALSAMRLSSSLPLTVYLWSFFPALLAVITISAGQQTAHQAGLWGLGLLWSGVGLLIVYVGGAFWMVRKH
jgi:lipopolysaccharide export LptBFGC system permease protein LptF